MGRGDHRSARSRTPTAARRVTISALQHPACEGVAACRFKERTLGPRLAPRRLGCLLRWAERRCCGLSFQGENPWSATGTASVRLPAPLGRTKVVPRRSRQVPPRGVWAAVHGAPPPPHALRSASYPAEAARYHLGVSGPRFTERRLLLMRFALHRTPSTARVVAAAWLVANHGRCCVRLSGLECCGGRPRREWWRPRGWWPITAGVVSV